MPDTVEIAAGRLQGQEYKGTYVFQGVPYASPPLGRLRFRPPAPVEPWSGVRSAIGVGPSAPQIAPLLGPARRLLPTGSGGFDEDCLYLNVWTPAGSGRGRPVMVWIHGGGFVMGSGSTPVYSGRRLARRGDVVLVTLNYRLGALGFLQLQEACGGETPVASNLGIRDQIAALEWVRDNIEAFGGDPGNVTLFGESAGAMSVATLMGAPRARGLFHKAILQSGAAHHVANPERARMVAELFLSELGLSPEKSEGLAECSTQALLDAQHRTTLKLGIAQGTLPWQPAVDGDVLPEQPLDAVAKAASRGIPMLIGTNREEWKLFTLGDRRARRLDEAGLRRRLERIVPGRDAQGVTDAERALATYCEARAGHESVAPPELWVAIQTDRVFRYPATRLAELHGAHTPATYAYLFEWAPSVLRTRIGSCHALEIPFVFGTFRHPALRLFFGASQTVRTLSRVMQKAWLEFARSGNPNHDALAVWRPYTAERRSTMILGERCFNVDAPRERERRFWEGRLER
jgi:para-nitrobenzyl esterase